MQRNANQPAPRVVLLGASNLTRGISTAIETARLFLGPPLNLFIAKGHGRSYGMKSRVLGRALPGILVCGIWEALSDRVRTGHFNDQSSNTYALLSDIGNDIIYGVMPETVVAWVEECIERLSPYPPLSQRARVNIAVTLPPIESIRAMKHWQYTLVKSVLYPTHPLRYLQAIERAEELYERLVVLGSLRRAKLIPPSIDWYGFDPIHILPRKRSEAWRAIMAAAFDLDPHGRPLAKPSLRRWLRLKAMTPQQWWLWGVELGRNQPGGRLEDGSTISLF